ncbi:hypothetical protein [Nocardia flavorosea]|uniref:Tail assembly chaperone n=1 Tax=Nocardia flavorosea TaxID=53429 RepID=A0A846YNJ9_9NOCA|nr:hypothetical protein [Nocardia flavorosea]NKY60353.1 hypothetical protein [Nocardia flavorosea]
MAARAPRPKIEPKAESRFARLLAEANEKTAKVEPYVFDGVEPPIEVLPPSTVEDVLEVGFIMENLEDLDAPRIRRIFGLFFGARFDEAWEVLRDKPAELLILLLEDITNHFNGSGDVPGGS